MNDSITANPQHSNHVAVRRVLWLTLALNIMVAVIKLAYGYHANIVSLQADGFHTIFDALSNVIGLVALSIAMHPPDREHPYGHQKLEVAASLAIGMMIVLGFIEVGRGIWHAAAGGTVPTINPASYGVVIFTICVSLTVSWYERRAGKRYNSMILTTDAAHTFTDALAGVAVLAGMYLVHIGFPVGDILAALAVMIFIGATAFRVLREGLGVIVDASLLDAEAVRNVVEALPQVRSCHYVRSRGMPGHVHLDLHITLDPQMRLAEAGELLLLVKSRLHERFPELLDILVQIEPHYPVHYEDVPEALL
ncbi:MAG: cation transporter [Bradymonadaceae bacterium]|nr:cation transporter [Lujinxingiaceae bacterium]